MSKRINPNDKLREALLPCPFCGEKHDLTVHVYGNGEDDAYVQCRECTTCGPDGGDREGAIIKWNQRAALAQPAVAQADHIGDANKMVEAAHQPAAGVEGVKLPMRRHIPGVNIGVSERAAQAHRRFEEKQAEAIAVVVTSVPHLRSIIVNSIPGSEIPAPNTVLYTLKENT